MASNEVSEDRSWIAQFDHRDHESAYCPWDRWQRLRNEAPIAHSEVHGGFWVLSRYREIFEAVRNPELFSSKLAQTTIPTLPTPLMPPIMYDPPEHRDYRVIVNPLFSPAAIREYEPRIRELGRTLISEVVKRPAFDIAKDIGVPLTRDIILRIMGLENPPAEVKQWSEDLVLQRGDPAVAGAMLMQYLGDMIALRRAAPGEDLISRMLSATYGDRPLSDDETLRMALLVLLAGLDTTSSAIAGSVWYLVQHPEAQAELAAADATTWRLALDELVRWVSPAPAQARTLREDAVFEGCPMHSGDRILLLYGSANRDPEEFPDPDKVKFDRFPNRHMGFGMGPHRCLGSHLAKLELQVVLENLLPHLHNIKFSETEEIVWEGGEVRGIRSLPLVRAA